MIVVVTDASVRSTEKVSGYGIYIDVEGKVIQKSGVFQAFDPSTSVAELTAIANALILVGEELDQNKTYEHLRIYTDNKTCVRIIKGVLSPNNTKYQDLPQFKTIQAYTTFKFDKVEIFHIAAHQVKNDYDKNKIHLMQHWCDAAAVSATRLEVINRNIKALDSV